MGSDWAAYAGYGQAFRFKGAPGAPHRGPSLLGVPGAPGFLVLGVPGAILLQLCCGQAHSRLAALAQVCFPLHRCLARTLVLPCRVVLQQRREERKRKRSEEEATKEAEEDKDSKEAAKDEGEAKKAKTEDAVKQEVSSLSGHAGGKGKVQRQVAMPTTVILIVLTNILN